MWPTKMKIDWPYSEIGQKMANGYFILCSVANAGDGMLSIIILSHQKITIYSTVYNNTVTTQKSFFLICTTQTSGVVAVRVINRFFLMIVMFPLSLYREVFTTNKLHSP